jgi:hypothetical protein
VGRPVRTQRGKDADPIGRDNAIVGHTVNDGGVAGRANPEFGRDHQGTIALS